MTEPILCCVLFALCMWLSWEFGKMIGRDQGHRRWADYYANLTRHRLKDTEES